VVLVIPLWVWRLALAGEPRAVFVCVRLMSFRALQLGVLLRDGRKF
jgi:hypothetical protein